MSNYQKKKLISDMQQRIDEYNDPETDPRTRLYDAIEELEDMDKFDLMNRFDGDEDSGFAVKDKVLEDLKKAGATQDEIDRVDGMTPDEALSEFGDANAETIRQNAINNIKNQISIIDEKYRYLQGEFEEIKRTPAKYFLE